MEFLYPPQGCLVNQREVGADTSRSRSALKGALREDPDIILVGELRELETTSTAVTAAETGHLCSPPCIPRARPPRSPAWSTSSRPPAAPDPGAAGWRLRGVVGRRWPAAEGTGRVLAAEVMIVTPAIGNLIREGKTHLISSAIQTGGRDGMLSFDRPLAERVRGIN